MSAAAVRFKGPEDLPPEVFDRVRLAAVRASGLLDTAPEPVFDDLAGLAITITGAPMAFVTVVDERRSFWKSVIGLGELPIEKRQNAAEASFCHLVVAADGPLIVTDAATDERVRTISSVTEMGIGAWAGYPIHSPDGQVLGTFCVVDSTPRDWTETQIKTLATLARAVTGEIALRGALEHMRTQVADLRATSQAAAALARTLQDSLLPPKLAEPPGIEAAARYLPAGQGVTVLGDFYDLFAASPSRWCVVMGDVAGHGVEAAKVTALARYTVRADAPHHISSSRVLEQLNTALLAQRVSAQRFLTAVCAIFRTDGVGITGVLSTAGHPSALVRHADEKVEELRSAGAMLGVFPDAGLANTRFTLHPGEVLLFYTDGVTEARRPADGEMFGEERLHALLADCAGLDAAAVVERISETVLAYCAHDSVDDIALLALRVPPAGGAEER
ncbi:PP2C family protein-serine/threonine phosphatase [Streptosporangium sp. 'caverna']|uniref:PP2C family protein-serine/threonine phosphatase n=1 Tax=Streptosporangium sp. 'caverna' TaxID=2202249 RepID=UPI000D7EB827|nr:GAF domain-containing SpoIIE family protein phosphatase [Streptosporangium sp. 'caverna']AWS43275.1 serine/threonine protein phosphatase [Streptosporangium sp. 'caverna']